MEFHKQKILGDGSQRNTNHRLSWCLLSLNSSYEINPVFVSTFSEAVASLVPCKFIAMQLNAASWAAISCGGRSVLAKSTIWTCPVLRAGKASNELLLLGQRTHRPIKGGKY